MVALGFQHRLRAPVDTAWITFGYQYLVGSITFALLVWLAVSKGALKLSVRQDRHILYLLILGLGSFMLVHGLWTLIVV